MTGDPAQSNLRSDEMDLTMGMRLVSIRDGLVRKSDEPYNGVYLKSIGQTLDDQCTETQIKVLGQELCIALQAVADEVPAKSQTPHGFASSLKVHRTLVGRLLSALRTGDPLAAISRMPRSEGLRMILQAARSVVSPNTIKRADAALRSFEQVVQNDLGGWDGFDAAITEWLAGARADVQLDTAIYYPNEAGDRCDIALIEGMVNLRRLRPSVRIRVASHTPQPVNPTPLEFLSKSQRAEQGGLDYPLLEQFCSAPCPKLDVMRTGSTVNYLLSGNDIGLNSAVDIFAANIVRNARPLYRRPDEPETRRHWSAGINVPSKTLLMNVLMHEDVWPGEPHLLTYNLHVHGMAEPFDPSRELDRMEMVEALQPLGRGASRFRAVEAGSHVEMVQHVCESLGWDSERLQGYRARIQYPLPQVQYCIAFAPAPIREA